MAGEQQELIDTAPENAEEIIKVAREYKKWVTKRLKANKKECELKERLKDMMQESGLQRLEDGSIKWKHDDMLITVEFRDPLIKVKDAKPEEAKEPEE